MTERPVVLDGNSKLNGNSRKGNRRTGIVRGSHSGTRRGTLEWRKDPLIRERIDLVWTLWARGFAAHQMLPEVNELMRRRGVPEIGVDTIYNDRSRIKELIREGDSDAKERHVETQRLIQREAWRAFYETKETSLNRSAYLNTVRASDETLAKIDGSMAPQKVSLTLEQIEQELQVIDGLLAEPDAADEG